MDLSSFKAAIIKRSRNSTSLGNGSIIVYQDVSFVYPDGKTKLTRNVLMSEYINKQVEVKKPYNFYSVPITIPISFLQSGFFIARKTFCIFGIYDGKNMREDVKNTIKLVSDYRRTVLYTSITMMFLGLLLITFGGLTMFLGLTLVSWFLLVFIFALILNIGKVEYEMQTAVDLDRVRLDEPPPPQTNPSP